MFKIVMTLFAIIAAIAFVNNYISNQIISQSSLLKWMWFNVIVLAILGLIWLNSKKTAIHLAMAIISFIGCVASIISIIILNV